MATTSFTRQAAAEELRQKAKTYGPMIAAALNAVAAEWEKLHQQAGEPSK